MQYFSNDHKYYPNQQENSQKVFAEKGHSVLSLEESKWKLRQCHDQNFPMNAAEQILGSEKINNSKKAELRESQSGIQVRTLNIRVRSIEKKYNSSPGLPVPAE